MWYLACWNYIWAFLSVAFFSFLGNIRVSNKNRSISRWARNRPWIALKPWMGVWRHCSTNSGLIPMWSVDGSLWDHLPLAVETWTRSLMKCETTEQIDWSHADRAGWKENTLNTARLILQESPERAFQLLTCLSNNIVQPWQRLLFQKDFSKHRKCSAAAVMRSRTIRVWIKPHWTVFIYYQRRVCPFPLETFISCKPPLSEIWGR